MAGGSHGQFLKIFIGVNQKIRWREDTLHKFLKIFVGVNRKIRWREETLDNFLKIHVGDR